MTILLTQISSMVGRWNNAILVEQSNESNVLVGDGHIPKLVKPEKVGVINITAGEHGSIGVVANGGTLPTGDDVQPAQATYTGVGIHGRLSLPRESVDLASSLEDGIDLVKEQMKSLGEGLGRQQGQMLFKGGNLGSPATAVTANVSTTFDVADPAGWRVGMAFEVYNGSTAIEGHTEATRLRVTDVARPSPGAGGNTTITFTGSGTGSAAASSWLTTYTIYLRGTKSVLAMASLADVTAAATMHGVAHTTAGWRGVLDSDTTTLSVPALEELVTTLGQVRGKTFSKSVTSRRNARRYANQLQGQIRFMDGKLDASGQAPEFYGRPIIIDDNCPDTDWYLLTDGDLQLHVFREFGPEIDGAKKTGMSKAAILLSQSTNTYDVQVRGTFQLRPNRRNGTARMNALAA